MLEYFSRHDNQSLNPSLTKPPSPRIVVMDKFRLLTLAADEHFRALIA